MTTTQQNTQKTYAKTNPVGLKALTKLIVFGDENITVFSPAERLFIDTIESKTQPSHLAAVQTLSSKLSLKPLNALLRLKRELFISARLLESVSLF